MKKRIAVMDERGALCAHLRNLLDTGAVEFLPLPVKSVEEALQGLKALAPIDAVLFDCFGNNALCLAAAEFLRRETGFAHTPMIATTALPLTPALSARFLDSDLHYLKRPLTRSDLETLLFGALSLEESIENFH
jgi:hypothetical protein